MIGLKMLKSIDSNFPTARFVFVQNSFENDQTYLLKKTKSCSLLCPNFNNKMKTKKVEEEQITLGKQVCFFVFFFEKLFKVK